MNASMLIVIVPALLLVMAGFAWILDKKNGRPTRNPDKVIRKIQMITDPIRLSNEFRQWTNPEIREAVLHRLPPQDAAELLQSLQDREVKEILNRYKDIDELKAILPCCANRELSIAEDRIFHLYKNKIETSKDQIWLGSVVKSNERTEVRLAAAKKLSNQEQIKSCIIWSASQPDEMMLACLMDRVEDPQEFMNLSEIKALPKTQQTLIRKCLICEGRHRYRNVHPGIVITASPYHPTRMEVQKTARCFICGIRKEPAYQAEKIPLTEDLPEAIKKEFETYRKIQNMPEQELCQFICDQSDTYTLRVAAAEKLSDEKMILDLLQRKLPGQSDQVKDIKEILIWQLNGPGRLFESIAKSMKYDEWVRIAAVSRIVDFEALDRLSNIDILKYACDVRRQDLICRDGHDWEVIRDEVERMDEHDWGSIRYRYRTCRCKRCGAIREEPPEQC